LNPLVSIIIPAYNKSQLTVKTVESVLNQTYQPIEIIVVDDGSKDDTREQLSRYADKIQYVYKENGGACSARNLGFKLSQGDYIGFLDCDDVYHPEKIQLSVNFLEQHPDDGWVHTAVDFIDEDGVIVGDCDNPESRHQGWITRHLILRNFICNSTPLIRRSCLIDVCTTNVKNFKRTNVEILPRFSFKFFLKGSRDCPSFRYNGFKGKLGLTTTINVSSEKVSKKTGVFDETIFTPADWDLWLRLSEEYQAGYIPRRLTQYRVSQNYVFKNLELAQREEIQVLEKFFERHPELHGLRKLAQANIYLRFAQCYLLKDDLPRVKEEFLSCLKYFPFHVKAWFLLGYFLVARDNLRDRLQKKILGFSSNHASRVKLCQGV